MHVAHVAALETTIVAEDWSGTIEIRSTLDGNVVQLLWWSVTESWPAPT